MTEAAGNTSFEELMKGTTTPDSVRFQMKGFPDEDSAKKLANWTMDFVRYIGTQLNLEGLDGITIAFDYIKALVDLDRGYETSFVLKPTTEFAQGVAMSPAVKRDGVIKTHIVFDANIFVRFQDENDEFWPWLFYQLAHECGHVHDRRAMDLALPNFLLTKYDFGNRLEATRYELGDGCWSEYAASRLSASFYEGQIGHYEETFFTIFDGIEERTSALEAVFSASGDGTKFFTDLCREYERLLRFGSYLLGHLSGLGGDPSQAPKFKDFLESGHWLVEYVIELDKSCEKLWANYGKWTSPGDFMEIGTLVLFLVTTHKVHASVNSDGEMFIAIY